MKILVAQSIHQDGLRMLQEQPDFQVSLTEDLSEENLIAMAQDVDVITVRNAIMTEKILRSAPKLKFLSRHGVGVDNIDMAVATELGIPVGVTNNANAATVTEHTFMFLLALAKDAVRYDRETRKGNFAVRYEVTSSDLAGKNLLIVGVGRIGRRVARIAQAFGMRVFGYDPYVSKIELRARDCEPVTDLHAALPQMDAVTLHCPKTPETVGLISAPELASMKSTAILVNCARGGLIDEKDMETALKAKTIKGIGLDVFDVEPVPASHPLLALPNLFVSPHSAATSDVGLRKMGMEVAQNIIDWHAGTLEDEMIFNAADLRRESQK